MKQYRTLLLALLAVLALTVCALADGEEGDEPVTDTVVEVADQTVEIVSDPDAPQDNDELFYEYMLRLAREQMTPARPTREPTRGVHEQEMGLRSGEADGSRPPANVALARENLNEVEKGVYDSLKNQIRNVAKNGGRTEFSASLKDAVTRTGEHATYNVPEEGEVELYTLIYQSQAEELEAIRTAVNTEKVVNALLVDCPYDLYWFDKTSYGTGIMGLYGNGTLARADGPQLIINFTVAGAYGSDGVVEKQDRVAGAAATAAGIVEEVAASANTDYKKLLAYKERICALVDYNNPAADNNATPYGDPWQLIWVFDNDASTKVVCEGYSKAFKYLCDLSTFENNIQCYIVDGYMGGPNGGHMWNVVTMEDGKNYLVDVTNCDGWPDQNRLFLKGSNTGPTLDTITVDLPSGEGTEVINQGYEIIYKYWYSTKMLTTWGNGELAGSILELSTTDYEPPTIDYTAGPTDSNYSYCTDGTTLHLKPTSGTAYLILARYSSGKLVEVKVQEVSTECSIENMTVSTEWKIFSVDGMGTCVPQGAALPLEISNN